MAHAQRLKPEVGHKFQFRAKLALGFDGLVDCEVLALDPQRRLVITWRGGGIDTTVTFLLSPIEDGTELSLLQEGFKVSNFIP